MTERINHVAETKVCIDYARKTESVTEASLSMMQAQVHATLALVEQQKIANLIALMATNARSVAEGKVSFEDYLELHEEINPIIVEGLGL